MSLLAEIRQNLDTGVTLPITLHIHSRLFMMALAFKTLSRESAESDAEIVSMLQSLNHSLSAYDFPSFWTAALNWEIKDEEFKALFAEGLVEVRQQIGELVSKVYTSISVQVVP